MPVDEPQISMENKNETKKSDTESGAASGENERLETTQSIAVHTLDTASSVLDKLKYIERQGANEVNVGFWTNTIYAGLTFNNDSIRKPPTPFLGIAKAVGDSGDKFTLEIDPRDPAAGQFLAFNRRLGESGNLRLGVSLDLKTSPKPTAYELAIRGELPVLRGEAGLTIRAAPPIEEEPARFETLASYVRKF